MHEPDMTSPASAKVSLTLIMPKNSFSFICCASETTLRGQQVSIQATVDHPPTDGNLVLTLTHRQRITIPQGSTWGATIFQTRGKADKLCPENDETLTIGIRKAEGGGYDSLDISAVTTLTIQHDVNPSPPLEPACSRTRATSVGTGWSSPFPVLNEYPA